jgi:hypothetical protein
MPLGAIVSVAILWAMFIVFTLVLWWPTPGRRRKSSH